jgi:hypothetical protein
MSDAAHPLANSGNVAGYDLAHYVGRGDPRHDGPYLDDVHAAQEDQYREARTASMKRTDEAIAKAEGDGLVSLDREREITNLKNQANKIQESDKAQEQAQKNSEKDQVPLGVAQDPVALKAWNSKSDKEKKGTDDDESKSTGSKSNSTAQAKGNTPKTAKKTTPAKKTSASSPVAKKTASSPAAK